MVNEHNMKRLKALDEAMKEATRFIYKAGEASEALSADEIIFSSPEFAAAKRSSMDLTRSLAKLRKAQA